MRRESGQARAAMRDEATRPAFDNRQKFPIIKRTGAYQRRDQFRIRSGKRLRGIRRYVLSSFLGTHDHTRVGRRVATELSRKEILLSCSWCFLHRSSLMTPCDNYSMLIWRTHIAFVSPAELACQSSAREQNLSPIELPIKYRTSKYQRHD